MIKKNFSEYHEGISKDGNNILNLQIMQFRRHFTKLCSHYQYDLSRSIILFFSEQE
jgi:hypothetical protein